MKLWLPVLGSVHVPPHKPCGATLDSLTRPGETFGGACIGDHRGGMHHNAEGYLWSISGWTLRDSIFSAINSIAIILLWICLAYGILHGDMILIVGAGFILVLDVLYDIKNKEGGG